MRARYQRGFLRLGHRKTRPACWEFLWWDNESTGRRVRRKAVIGTVNQYPNVEDAWQASNGLRVSINEVRNRQREQLITVADLIDHTPRRNWPSIWETKESRPPRELSTKLSSAGG
jgi:hypothetical protein